MDSILAPSAALATRTSTPLSNAASALIAAARLLLADLERGRAIDAKSLRAAMTAGFGSSDAEGAWDWKSAYEACEAAQILFLRKFGPAMRARAGSSATLIAMLTKIAALLPSHTRRSEAPQLRLVSPQASRLRSCPPTSCSNLQRAPASLPSMPRLRAAVSF
jgi:protein strawberry notch